MDQVRTRKSFGNLKAAGGDVTQTQLEAFEDFRRRHSKQNREVVMDNAQRKLALRELQDQINALQLEVIQVKSKNSQLERQLAKARETQAGPNANIAMRALDQILGAVPALHALRDVLSNPTELTVAKKRFAASSIQLAGPSAPRIIDREDKNRLVAIAEDWEAGSEDEGGRPQASEVAAGQRTVSGQSAAPANIVLPPSPISPALSSPSPQKRKSPRKKPQKRRRESGLLQAHQASPPPETASPDRAPVLAASTADLLSESASAPIAASSSHTPARPRAAIIPPSTIRGEQGEEGGGRGRRSRQSVNYKEPSLTKKMRKPDGLSAEDALRIGAGRPSLLLESISPLASPLPPVQQDLPSQRSTSQRSKPSESGVRRKSIIPRAQAASAAPVSSDDDDDELPEVEDMLPIVDEPRAEPPRATTKKYMEIRSIPDAPSLPSTSSSSSSSTDRMFSPTPIRQTTPMGSFLASLEPTKSVSTAPGRPVAISAAPARAASRPAAVKVSNPALAYGNRPSSPKVVSSSGRKIQLTSKMAQSSSLGRIATGQPRGALKDLKGNQ